MQKKILIVAACCSCWPCWWPCAGCRWLLLLRRPLPAWPGASSPTWASVAAAHPEMPPFADQSVLLRARTRCWDKSLSIGPRQPADDGGIERAPGPAGGAGRRLEMVELPKTWPGALRYARRW